MPIEVRPYSCIECPMFEINWLECKARCNHPSRDSTRLTWLGEDWAEDMKHPTCPGATVTIILGE